MGKIRIRVLGLEEIEKKQKEEQKKRREEKKKKKVKVEGVGLKGGERIKAVEISEEELEKERKAKEILELAEKKKDKEKEEGRRFVKIKHPRGKKYKSAKKEIEKALKGRDSVSIKEAVELLKKISYAKFDEAVELHLNVTKVGLKGEVKMPYSIGKEPKVKIVDDKFIEDLEKGQVDLSQIDVLISHPSYMPKLSKFARILGPKKLFPNPKQGTLTEEPEKAVERFKSGVLQWKTEPKFPLIHQIIGRVSYDTDKIVDNAIAFLRSVGKSNIREAYIKTTMSPSIKLSLEEI